ncbi:ATP synthase CF0 subunit I (chloroplast) [Sorghum bicolor]|jgi:F-type H+-transporting ATPase subunit b|uniref:ATP synthase subunit b, chloroplastic n=13 Tax=Andropogoneae TaxID=147429 RepID=ATPF_SORBI|nr:ATP synthase CF0 subunit I [Chrysopogon serrulatus]YP_009385058.1 ATP synthase CF0 subunit I [Sorghum mekongense]YP_009386303.1 ATP synthase CF0 subunit I [Hyparrhenia diplandra]YP_009387131.1 ATP synthase CF0 subunit I [Chrysopogon orientalis]YP_009543958.1 ATP synthase CF0 subunit I [Hyparrhenia variabilis]YP_009654008.1 ATP synthase CF0 B subunit [Sorghum propinquum]YP_009654092.1 ATP synthase CF0 B subunit [Sorghum bicolor subsp. drummondii]YP_010951258.1 CF0 subunit I [Sorghum bicolo|eukprot:YP_899403.1 ATP synthase CF0 subunit I (chloroplast) [Sorghum bicolor]
MKNVTHSFVFLAHWPFAGSFGLNTDILATNLINLTVVVGVLIFFGKGVLKDLLDNRKQRILSTIRNSEELRRGTLEQLEKARIRLQKVELEADEYRMNGYSEIEREKENLINATSISLEQLEKSKNETLFYEKQRAMNQVRQRVFQQAVQGALGTLNSCLNTELHFRTIRANIGILGAIEWKR